MKKKTYIFSIAHNLFLRVINSNIINKIPKTKGNAILQMRVKLIFIFINLSPTKIFYSGGGKSTIF